MTIEGEHTCLMLLKQDQSNSYKEPLAIEIIPVMNAPYQSQTLTIALDRIKIIHAYRYLFQYKAIRIVTDKCEEYIFEFSKLKYCQRVLNLLLGESNSRSNELPLCLNLQNHLFTSMLSYYQDAWRRGMLSNGEYLLYLNFIAHRSFNDLTQYPVFPWIV